MSVVVDTALSYALSLVGAPYKWWHPGDEMIGDHGPFWAFNGEAPPAATVKSSAVTCTGLINLMRRHVGKRVPGVAEKSPYAGGTYEWFNYLKENGRLEPYNPTAHYPKGTLLLSPWVDPQNQGHVAVLMSDTTLLHSYSEELYTPEARQFVSPGVTLEPIERSHSWKADGYYTHVCLQWLEVE